MTDAVPSESHGGNEEKSNERYSVNALQFIRGNQER